MVIINSPQYIAEEYSNFLHKRFSDIANMRIIANFLKEALNDYKQEELIDKIMILLQKITLTKEILDNSHIGGSIIRLREKNQLPEIIKSKVIRYYTKYRDIIEENQDKYKSQDQKKYSRDKLKPYEEGKKKIRKNSDDSPRRRKDRKKSVRFLREEDLKSFKIFKKDDEPNQKGLSTEDHELFLKKYAEELKYKTNFTADEIKHLESQMEGRSHKQMQNTVDIMREQISYQRPLKLANDQIDYNLQTSEQLFIQDRNQLKLGAYYQNESMIPPQPTIKIENSSNQSKLYKTITMEIPNKDDILSVVTMICQNKEKEVFQEQQNKNRKPMKGILKKPPGEKKLEEEQDKADYQQMIQKLAEILQNQQKYQQSELFGLINEMVSKLTESGNTKYIKNISTIVSQCFNSEQQKQQEQMIQQSRLIEQQNFMKNRQMQHQQHQNNNPQQQQQQQMQQRPYFPQQQNMQMQNQQQNMQQPFIQQQQFKAYKTKPCMNYHSLKGCLRGDNCNFIHDQRYQGVPVPQQMQMQMVGNVQPRTMPNLFNQLIPNLSPQHQPVLGRLPQFPSSLPQNSMQQHLGPSKYESL